MAVIPVVGEVADQEGGSATGGEQSSCLRGHLLPVTLITQQVSIISLAHLPGQGATQAAHIGNIDQPESIIGGQDYIAHVQGAEVDAAVVQLSNEIGQSSEEFAFIECGLLVKQLAQRLPLQRVIVHDGAVRLAQAVQLYHLRAGYSELQQCVSVVCEALGRGVEGGFGQPALATEQLEKGTVGQAQDLLSVPVLLQHLGVGAPGGIFCPAQYLH